MIKSKRTEKRSFILRGVTVIVWPFAQVFLLIRFIIRSILWLSCLLFVFCIADLIGNTILFIFGGPSKVNFHSKYFFRAKEKVPVMF